MSAHEAAKTPEDLMRLFVARANAGDAAGMAALYAEDAVLAYPPGKVTVGRDAILAVLTQMVANRPTLTIEGALPTLAHGDIALTSTRSADNRGTRVQVVRRQPDGTWLRIIDRPEQPEP